MERVLSSSLEKFVDSCLWLTNSVSSQSAFQVIAGPALLNVLPLHIMVLPLAWLLMPYTHKCLYYSDIPLQVLVRMVSNIDWNLSGLTWQKFVSCSHKVWSCWAAILCLVGISTWKTGSSQQFRRWKKIPFSIVFPSIDLTSYKDTISTKELGYLKSHLNVWWF